MRGWERALTQDHFPNPSNMPANKADWSYREPKNKRWLRGAHRSRSCQPIQPTETRRWITFWDTNALEVAEAQGWFEDLPDMLWLDHVTRIETYLQRAIDGVVIPNDEGEPIKATSVSEELFEFRWTLSNPEDEETKLRQYHGEPRHENEVVDYFVRTHIHIKHDRSGGASTRAQTESMRFALQRYQSGESTNWSPRADDSWISSD